MKRNKILIICLVIFIVLSICNIIYARYKLTKNQNIIINTAPFIFEAEIEKEKVVIGREGADIAITIKNYNTNSEFNSYPVDYEISLTNNQKFTISSDVGNIENDILSNTIEGGSSIDNTVDICIVPKEGAILLAEEIITINIKSTKPYKKEINFPITINTNPSTLSGIELNFLIKNGEYAPEGDVYEYYSVDANRLVDNTIKKIVFGKYSEYKNKVSGITAEPIDVNRIGVINLYRALNSDNSTYTIYILSEDGKFELSENAAWTFDKLYSLESIENLHLLDTSKVTNMRDMFCDCASLKTVDLSNFQTSKVTDMIGMFARMTVIEYLDLITFDTSSVEKSNQMFTTDSALKRIYVSNKWNLANVTEGTGMFTACTNLVGGNGTALDTTKLTYTMAVIDGTTPGYLTSVYSLIDGVSFNAYIKGKTDTEIANWAQSARFSDTSVTSITFGKTRDYYKIIDGYDGVPADMHKGGGVQVYRIPNGNGTYSAYVISNSGIFTANSDSGWLFDKLYMLDHINNLTMLDTSKVTNMRDMFCDCASLSSLDLSNFNTSKATSMEGMFARMYIIQTLDLSSFNTANVTTMASMFVLSISSTETLESFQNATPALHTIYVSSSWNTSKIASTQSLFANCVNLVGGAGTVFNTSNVTVTYARVDTASTPGYFTLK